MNVRDSVKNARTPQEALLILADAIDALREIKPEADPWGQPLVWDDPEEHVLVDEEFTSQVKRQELEAEIASLQDLAAQASGEDRQALEARVRLLRDELRPVQTVEAPEKDTPTVEVTAADGSTTITLPVVDDAKQAARREFAINTCGIREYYPNREDLVQSYGKGGPLLFYYDDREWVMSLPYGVRTLMIEDIMEDMPDTAKKVARDILKREDDGDPTITAQYVQGHARS